MAMFFNYDNGAHKHSIAGFVCKNEKNEIVGYRPVVDRHPKGGGIVETISDRFPQVKWSIFSTEKLARDFAINYFGELTAAEFEKGFKFEPLAWRS